MLNIKKAKSILDNDHYGFDDVKERFIEYLAVRKLKDKNIDLIVLNSLNDNGAGFNHDTNKITIIDKQNNIYNFKLKNKAVVAKDIIKKILEKIK